MQKGRVRRGFRFRAYPTHEQTAKLREIQRGLRRCWNWLCARAEDTREANASWVVRQGLTEPRPMRPDEKPGAKPLPEQWSAWKLAMREWCRQVREAAAGNPQCAIRSLLDWQTHFYVPELDGGRKSKHARLHDYQVFARALDWGGDLGELPPAAYLQALCKDHKAALSATTRGQRPPKFRRRDDDMSLRICSGQALRLEAGGPRPRCQNGKAGWLNARISLPGVGRVWCRIGSEQLAILEQEQWRLEGVSLTREADGWYAAIRQDVQEPAPRPFIPGTACGIDVGLVELFALVGTDGHELLVPNPRKGFTLRRPHAKSSDFAPADWPKGFREDLRKCLKAHSIVTSEAHEDQMLAVLSGADESRLPMRYQEFIALRQAAGLPVSRLQCRAARNIRQIVRERLFREIDQRGYEFIFVEQLDARIGQQGLAHVSAMRTVVRMLETRYNKRVLAVDPYLSSHQCSQCGHVGDRSWSEMPDRLGRCSECLHAEHSDTNAARVILRRGLGQIDTPPRDVGGCAMDGQRSIEPTQAAEADPNHRIAASDHRGKRNRSKTSA